MEEVAKGYLATTRLEFLALVKMGGSDPVTSTF